MVSVSGGVPLSERLPLEFRRRSIRFRLLRWGAGVPPLAAVHHVPTTGVATAHPFAESEEFWSRRRGRGGLKATASLVSIDKSGHSTS
jgi:hypothetical protein